MRPGPRRAVWRKRGGSSPRSRSLDSDYWIGFGRIVLDSDYRIGFGRIVLDSDNRKQESQEAR